MNWRVVVRPEVERDVSQAADWYDSKQGGLGAEFREEVIQVLTNVDKSATKSAQLQSQRD